MKYFSGCGDIFTRPFGNFTSPNYPNAYPHGVTCEWSILTDYGSVIELTINDLDIEVGLSCFDKLVVRVIFFLKSGLVHFKDTPVISFIFVVTVQVNFYSDEVAASIF